MVPALTDVVRRVAALLLLAALVVVPGRAQAWTWVHGDVGASKQAEYLAFARRMHAYYQGRGAMRGDLVAERDLKACPDGSVVFIGPLAAFEHRDWFGVPIEARADGGAVIGGETLRGPRVGIFLRSRDRTRLLLGGTDLAGFGDIFSVPTGRDDCTVTRARGEVSHSGSWTAGGLTLAAAGFLTGYPTADDAAKLTLPDGVVDVAPVVDGPDLGGLAPEFRSWLGDFVADRRVLFVGESHWNAGINRVFDLILADLLERGVVRSVFLEINYSFAAFYDHYVHEADDARAGRFLREHMQLMVQAPSTLRMLDRLRRWNARHPKRAVRVGGVDMEWGHDVVLERILAPFFVRVDPEFVFTDPRRAEPAERDRLRERVQGLLADARKRDVAGPLPFMTADYIERVVTNLMDTVGIDDFNADRQAFIVRNIGSFQGDLLGEGLAVFKGGGYHAMKRRPEGEAFYRDAAWLDEVCPTTKGRVATLWLAGLGYSFADVAQLDFTTHLSSATNYNNFVRRYQEAARVGAARPDAHYLLDRGISTFARLMVGIGHARGVDVLRVAGVDWKRLAATHGEAATRCRPRNYDATVYVLRSTLEPTRRR